FHDILPGSSIARVYEEARADIARIRDTAVRGAREALLAFCQSGEGMTVFNPSSHRITRVIRADSRFSGGAVTQDAVLCNEHGIDAFFPIVRGVSTLDDAMNSENAHRNMADTAEQVFRLIKTIRGE
ncbi:MAG: glycerate kinase, partial [Solobacterium sp.]|nr:glycerate kinase [Solobacterium sp.]